MIVHPIKAVSFDANGTLIHSPRLGDIYAEVLTRHGVRIGGEEALRLVRRVWEEFSLARRTGEDRFAVHPGGARGWWYQFIDRVCLHAGQGLVSPFAKAELFGRFATAEAWEVYEEVPQVLAELDALGLRRIVLSNWDDRLPLLLERLGLAGFFESVIFSAQAGSEKPFPAIFHRAVERLGLPPERILHVGDREQEDVEGARAVGMQALQITRGSRDSALPDLRPLVDLLRPP